MRRSSDSADISLLFVPVKDSIFTEKFLKDAMATASTSAKWAYQADITAVDPDEWRPVSKFREAPCIL
jgi:hypothetical protein